MAPPRLVVTATSSLWLLVPATSAHAHGGVPIAEGQRDGVTVLVQGSAATTPAGAPAADLATTLAGPGTGQGASVTYWVRPSGAKTFSVQAKRDSGGGVLHAEVATNGRGDWRTWDVSAVITLGTGDRLRVTNASSNPPGPDPARAAPTATPPATDANRPAATTPAPAASPSVAGEPVADISGSKDSAPAWAIPSLIGLTALGVVGVLVARRRRDD